jgi:hypothetical protein
MPTKFDLSLFVTRKGNNGRTSSLTATEAMAVTHPKRLANSFEFDCTTKTAASSFLAYLIHIQSPYT